MSEIKKGERINLDDDIVAEAGYWEPNSVLIRGSVAYEGLESDEYPYSEEMAKKLSDIGINLAIWHYYKAIGAETEEADEMARTEGFLILQRHFSSRFSGG